MFEYKEIIPWFSRNETTFFFCLYNGILECATAGNHDILRMGLIFKLKSSSSRKCDPDVYRARTEKETSGEDYK